MSDAVRCLAVTAKGTRCANDALDDSVLCAMHERITAERHAGPHVDDAVDGAVLHVAATEQQDPLVASVMVAAERILDGAWAADDDRMAHSLVSTMRAKGCGLPDVDLLISLGALPGWVHGYWRGAGYPTERPTPEAHYVDTDSGLLPVWTPAAGVPAITAADLAE